MTVSSSLTSDELGSAAQRERRRRILDATVALASEGGFDAVQMRAVADRAEVALGTLYRYFPSKIHLLVSALGRELEHAEAQLTRREIPGDSPAERVANVLSTTGRGVRGDRPLTEALIRAFMFADVSVRTETDHVGSLMTRMLTRAMDPTRDEVSEGDMAVAQVIGDVWLSALVGWVTGRATVAETNRKIEVAVGLLLRD